MKMEIYTNFVSFFILLVGSLSCSITFGVRFKIAAIHFEINEVGKYSRIRWNIHCECARIQFALKFVLFSFACVFSSSFESSSLPNIFRTHSVDGNLNNKATLSTSSYLFFFLRSLCCCWCWSIFICFFFSSFFRRSAFRCLNSRYIRFICWTLMTIQNESKTNSNQRKRRAIATWASLMREQSKAIR